MRQSIGTATLLLSLVSQLPEGPPNTLVAGVGPGLILTLDKPNPAMSTQRLRSSHRASGEVSPRAITDPQDVQFSINTSANSVSGLQGSIPIANLEDTSSTSNFIGASGWLDTPTQVANIAIPTSLFPDMKNISASMANWATGAPSQYGGRSFDGTSWVPFVCPKGPKVVVLVHGMYSSVESAFPCAGKIQAAGKYDAVVGFNYNWTQDINESGKQLATFLDNVAMCSGVNQVDIEAHSEGVPVSMSSTEQATSETEQKIINFVSLGGPIMGTPVATPPPIAFATGMLNLPGSSFVQGATLQKS